MEQQTWIINWCKFGHVRYGARAQNALVVEFKLHFATNLIHLAEGKVLKHVTKGFSGGDLTRNATSSP